MFIDIPELVFKKIMRYYTGTALSLVCKKFNGYYKKHKKRITIVHRPMITHLFGEPIKMPFTYCSQFEYIHSIIFDVYGSDLIKLLDSMKPSCYKTVNSITINDTYLHNILYERLNKFYNLRELIINGKRIM
jgi:hypothetical protein